MNSILGPFSLITATIISIIYFQTTKNMVISVIIGTIGPIALNFILRFFIRSWTKATHTETKPDFFSRLAGAVLTLIWGWVFIVFTLILLAVLPAAWGKTWAAVHEDVTKSISYAQIIQPLEKKALDAASKNDPALAQKMSAIITPPPKQNTAAGGNFDLNSTAKSLAEDPRFQKILQDPEIQNDMNTHDFVKLLSNPKMMALTQQIMSDPETMKKVMAVYRSQNQTPPQAAQNTE
jgi:hypothetical protein